MFRVQQNEAELTAFVDLLQKEHITSYLEIGCKWGGTLWRVSRILPKWAKIVAVDLPQNTETIASLRDCTRALAKDGFQVRLFEGDSTNPAVISGVREIGPFDAILIDANHTIKFVTADWTNYGPLGRIVAFHDVSWSRPTPKGRLPIEVPQLWNKIKKDYRYTEIKLEPQDNGFGVLWTH